jgi:hypothetical protein
LLRRWGDETGDQLGGFGSTAGCEIWRANGSILSLATIGIASLPSGAKLKLPDEKAALKS